jgi:hypothetical protein
MRMLLRFRAVSFGVAALATLSGCATSDSSDKGAGGGPTSAKDGLPSELSIPVGTADCSCEHDAPMTLASVDEAPAGVAARDLLALVDVDGPHPIRWQSESEFDWEAPREIVAASGQLPNQISIEVTYQDGEIRFSGPTNCWRIDVEVAVSLRSEHGALDEQVTGWLHAAGSGERGFATDPNAWLELVLHVPETSFRGTVSTAQDCMPLQGIAPLGGTLDVETTFDQQAPTDPVDGPWTLSQRGRMVAIPVHLRFDKSGVQGTMDAWLYGMSDGSLRLTENIAVVGTP